MRAQAAGRVSTVWTPFKSQARCYLRAEELQPIQGCKTIFKSVTQGSRAKPGARQPWAEFFNPVGIGPKRGRPLRQASTGKKGDRRRCGRETDKSVGVLLLWVNERGVGLAVFP